MPNCNICGQPVMIGVVHHAACWDRAANTMRQKFCDDYCRWPRETRDKDALDERCVSCPMVLMLKLGL